MKKLTKHGIPFVLIDRNIPDLDCDQVVSDNETTTRKLIEHLITQGHKKIAIINGPLDVSTARERQQAYLDTLKLHGIPVDKNLIKESQFRDSDVTNSIQQLLELPVSERPTAIFATNNFIGMNTIKTLHKNNIKIPKEMAVVSYDGIPNYTEQESVLTVAEQPAYNFGYIGIQLLIERIEGTAPEKARKIVLPADIHLRASSVYKRN